MAREVATHCLSHRPSLFSGPWPLSACKGGGRPVRGALTLPTPPPMGQAPQPSAPTEPSQREAPPPHAPPPSERRSSRGPLIAAAVVVVALLGVGFGAFALLSDDDGGGTGTTAPTGATGAIRRMPRDRPHPSGPAGEPFTQLSEADLLGTFNLTFSPEGHGRGIRYERHVGARLELR